MPQYAIYARKSTESEDRQVLSIDSQVKELREHADAIGLTVSKVLSESRSAKSPGRPVFGDLLQGIQRGQFRGVLCWKLDRLARNPVDGAALIWAMEEGKLEEIVSPGRRLGNTSNDKFWLQLEFGMAKKYVDDLSDNIRRGNRAKLEQGWFPGRVPVGYLNDRVNKTVIPDPDRFQQIRRIWELVLDGTPIPEILKTVNEGWGFRTPKRRRSGDVPLSRSVLYDLLENPFYHGLIVRNGHTYPGAHKAMISADEFDRVQRILGRPNRLPYSRHDFTYTGLITCGECGLSVTAEHKVNRYGSEYTYYHCTKRRSVPCQQPSIRLERLEDQIAGTLERLEVPSSFSKWAHDRLSDERKRLSDLTTRAETGLRRALAGQETKLDRLTDLHLRGLIEEPEYIHQRGKVVAEQVRLKTSLAKTEENPSHAFELSERLISFADSVASGFKSGDRGIRRLILRAVGSNLFLKDKTLLIQLKKPFQLLSELNGFPTWWRVLDGIRTYFQDHPDHIQLPTLRQPKQTKRRRKRRTK